MKEKDAPLYPYDPAQVMSLLAWVDILERLDTILAEARHAQTNILYLLRAPALYQALRFEEWYLWGEYSGSRGTGSWWDIFSLPLSVDEHARLLRELARCWVLRYPLGEANAEKEFSVTCRNYAHCDVRSAIRNNVLTSIRDSVRLGRWSMDERRHYHNLSLMQVIKSNVVADKLWLCSSAFRAHMAVDQGQPYSRDIFSDFYIVRSAVCQRLRGHVARLGDLQAQLEGSLDLSLQEDPPPMTVRRQEHGFYTSCVSMMCRELQANLDNLLEFVSAPKVASPRPFIMHRWSPDFTSAAEPYRDDVESEHPWRSLSSAETARFINSSYWMPDRPDLLAILSHEVAHGNLRQRYGNAQSPVLDSCDDSLARLVKSFYWCFRMHNAPVAVFTNSETPPPSTERYAVVEIIADFLAASVHGHAYLYAAFLDLSSAGVGDLLSLPDGGLGLELVSSLGDSIEPARLDFSWYFRIRLLCCWMRHTHHLKPGPLVDTLITGAERVVEMLLERLAAVSRQPARVRAWRALTDDMCSLVRASEASSVVKKWRGMRSEQVAPTLQLREGQIPGASAPRFTRRLEAGVREWLFKALLDRKKRPGRLLYSAPAADFNELERQYFGRASLGVKIGGAHTPTDRDKALLFRHVYDIPWECAILRGIDFVRSGCKREFSSWLKALHQEAGLGRELYKAAVEFYLWQTRPPYDRLAAALRLTNELVNRLQLRVKKGEPDLGQALADLKRWQGIDDSHRSQEEVTALFQEIGALLIRKRIRSRGGEYFFADISDAERLSEAYSAIVLQSATRICLPIWRTPTNVKPEIEDAIVEKLQGYKLRSLQSICEELRANPGLGRDRSIVEEMYAYLQLRQSRGLGRGDADEVATSLLLLQGFSNEGPVLHTIERLAVSSDDHPAVGGFPNLGVLITETRWVAQSGSRRTLFSTTLGRFDLFCLQPGPAMSRPSLPRFRYAPNTATTTDILEEERFLPFLVRREQAVLFSLGGSSAGDIVGSLMAGNRRCIAFLSILLAQRSARLTFLARLRGGSLQPRAAEAPQSLSEAASRWCGTGNAFALLSEGWGDVVVCFVSDGLSEDPPSEEALLGIFEFQNAVYHDFLVERTELVLTPECLAAAARSDRFKISVHLRVRGDGQLRMTNDRFEAGIDEAAKGAALDYELEKTPGKTDYVLTMPWAGVFSDGTQRGLSKFLEPAAAEIDDISTVVALKRVQLLRKKAAD